MNDSTAEVRMRIAQSQPGQPDGYGSGFGNEFSTETLAGALPRGRNNPQQCAYGLYAEQLSGTAFTAPRALNRRTWCYRIRPSVRHTGTLTPVQMPRWRSSPNIHADIVSAGQFRWRPLPYPTVPTNFISGICTMTSSGDINVQDGLAIHAYVANRSMIDEYFFSADGELLVVPQEGRIRFYTELGVLDVAPQEIAVIPRGMVYRVELLDDTARGFVCENYGNLFVLPELGPIGANGLANSRDFLTPVAAYEDRDAASTVTLKWCGGFYQCEIDHSPLDVVAWHGNYAPYKYDLRNFSPVSSVLFDHPDPSIFTVLTAPSSIEGVANIDFVLFRDRWMVGEDTFRPPWYHKNVMSEFMGNIVGVYDAKPDGFAPGSMSLHNRLMPHGPDAGAFKAASAESSEPVRQTNTMSFMFESRFAQHLSEFAANEAPLQSDYQDCWNGLEKYFDETKP